MTRALAPFALLPTLLASSGCYQRPSEQSVDDSTSSGDADDPSAGTDATHGPTDAGADDVDDAADGTTTVAVTDSGSSDDDDTSGADTGAETSGRHASDAVDVLFVVDNSDTMGEEQARLAASIAVLIDRLDDEGVDYRIGVTTTDHGNPWCTTEATAGQLTADSCRARLDAFVNEVAPVPDMTAEACENVCGLQALPIVPTPTDYDRVPAPRPWLERVGGEANVEGSIVDALSCLLPQGIAGCGFESPLQAVASTIAGADDPESAHYGFLRTGASLAVVIVTDEFDCSAVPDYDALFYPESAPVFWSDPDGAFPTSAVCWNAGVACVGDGMPYESCDPVDLDLSGAPTKPESAVLYPVSSYVEMLARRGASLTVIAGVPFGFGAEDDLSYAASLDPQIQLEYGIEPGCSGPGGDAYPPVRMRAVANTLRPGGPNLLSICEDDYAQHFDAIADRIVAEL